MKKGLSQRLRPLNKNVAKRPGAKEGGREEEEKRSRIANGPKTPVRLRDRKVVELLFGQWLRKKFDERVGMALEIGFAECAKKTGRYLFLLDCYFGD
jgi:hypothetical protein